jgi:L-alanine-DL-glutamate epimerase-like enolase superfamily enzyme
MSLAAGFAGGPGPVFAGEPPAQRKSVTVEQLDAAASDPILKIRGLTSPVKIKSIELLEFDAGDDDYYVLRARSSDGVEGYSLPNSRASELSAILKNRVIPCFIGPDVRQLETLLGDVYRYKDNYKLQSLALWCPVAWVEFALLDLLGKMLRKPMGALLGEVRHPEVPVYIAGGRELPPKQEADRLAQRAETGGFRAVKFRIGGRMSNNVDAAPGRTEALIPMMRKVLGANVTLMADANGSYDPPKAIEVGRMLEDIDALWYEEPCPFDHLEDTKAVADAVKVNLSGGEQESSDRRFRWMIANGVVQIVQPDLHYYGGFVRSSRVARMAAAAGSTVSIHLSGGLGYASMLQFASSLPNAAPFQEYKGDIEKTGGWFDPPITLRNGALTVPTAPGLGMTALPDLLKGARKIV